MPVISLLNLIAHANMSLTHKQDEGAGNAEASVGVFPQGGSLQAVERWAACVSTTEVAAGELVLHCLFKS